MKCADCKFFDRRMMDSRHDGYCLIEFPPYLADYVEARGVLETNGCDLGKPKEKDE